MRASIRRLASAVTEIPMALSIEEASVQLVPPIPLYRRLLRAHRHIPLEMRFMGDSYLKSEFRLTRKTENPLHIIAFLSQWKLYLDQLDSARTTGDSTQPWKGKRLESEKLEMMSKEQVGQLYELMHATKDVWKSTEQLEEEAKEAGVEGLDETKKH